MNTFLLNFINHDTSHTSHTSHTLTNQTLCQDAFGIIHGLLVSEEGARLLPLEKECFYASSGSHKEKTVAHNNICSLFLD